MRHTADDAMKRLEELNHNSGYQWTEYYEHPKRPYKCPVCEGEGYKAHSMCDRTPCKACEGKGIVWG